jgi:hypothetical protein
MSIDRQTDTPTRLIKRCFGRWAWPGAPAKQELLARLFNSAMLAGKVVLIHAPIRQTSSGRVEEGCV